MKITKTQLKEMIQKAVKEQLAEKRKRSKKSLKENSMVFGMASPSKMPNPFNRSVQGSGAKSRLNEMILRDKLGEAHEYIEYIQELLSDASKLATLTESGQKTKPTTKTVTNLHKQSLQFGKVIKKLLGNS